METVIGYKFEPIWVSTLNIITLAINYTFIKAFITQPSYDFSGLMFVILPILLAVLFLPMGIKMLMGIPAITFTHKQFVDNIFGVTIDWTNVQNVRLAGSRKPFLAIDLKDNEKFYASIVNPFKRILLKLLFSVSPGDVSINLAFVAGDNPSIVAVTQVYWEKHYNSTA